MAGCHLPSQSRDPIECGRNAGWVVTSVVLGYVPYAISRCGAGCGSFIDPDAALPRSTGFAKVKALEIDGDTRANRQGASKFRLMFSLSS